MKLGGLGPAGRDLRALLEGRSLAGLADGELLVRFVNGHGNSLAQEAFGTIVGRHGPMVWGTCRRILRDPHAAEDAFQATFLILVQKASSVRVENSLGCWLHGVAVRVALRARADRARRVVRDLVDVEDQTTLPTTNDLKAIIDEELERLPTRYRSVVLLCHLEGLTREHAADRLGCPVGTVNSRLSRAGEILRARLTRRGLAPASASLSVWLAGSEVTVTVPSQLVSSTLAAALRISLGETLAGLVPAGALVLLQETLRRMGMMTLLKTVGLGSTLLALATWAVGAAIPDGPQVEPAKRVRAADPQLAPGPQTPRPPTIAERFQAILAEWKAVNQKAADESSKGKTAAEQRELYWKAYPDEFRYFDRCLQLAAEAPQDLGARDAWLWIISEGMRNNDAVGPRVPQIRQAVDGLLLHHANDIRVIRTGLNIDNMGSANRTAFARGLYEKAQTHEAKGVAAVVLAQVLTREAALIEWAQSLPEQPKSQYMSHDDEGLPKLKEGSKILDDSYWNQLKQQDLAAVRKEVDDLYETVIADFADVPLNPRKYERGKIVPNPHPRSLAEHARAKLDDLHGLVEGKPAPEIAGVDLDGKPLKLSDFKGKVVAVVFWNSGCGPCLAAIPQERALLERLQGKPFAIIGVNTDEQPEAALKAVTDHKIPWSNWRDGNDGPITNRYHIKAFPTIFVIDADGMIQAKQAAGGTLDTIVEKLLESMPVQPAGSK